MKTLVINASPSGEGGKTWWVLSRFIEGIKEAGGDVTTITLAGKKIHHCSGELSCWFKTPGKCIHRDDMDTLLPLFKDTRALVFATPVYVDGMTGLLKNFIDRLVPTCEPFIVERNGHSRHESKSLIERTALVSVCGFPELDNFAPLVEHVKAICKNINSSFAGAVLRPAAPALNGAKIAHPLKTHNVSNAIKNAGKEFILKGVISDETAKAVSAEFFAAEDYLRHANASFEKALSKINKRSGFPLSRE